MGQSTFKNDYFDGTLRDFTLPVKLPIEALMSKYKGELDISMGNKMNDLLDELIEVNRGFIEKQPEKKIAKGHRNVTVRRKESQEQNNNFDDGPDCFIISDKVVNNFKAPYKTVKRSNQNPRDDSSPIASPNTKDTFIEPEPPAPRPSNVQMKRTAKRKRGHEVEEAKPGTLGSRQTLPIRRKAQDLNVQEDNGLIDTKNRITADMMVSVKELCQRMKRKKVPDDPTELLRKFSIVIPKLSQIDQYIDLD